MGKKSKRHRPDKGASRRETIQARRGAARIAVAGKVGDTPSVGNDASKIAERRAEADHHREQFIQMTNDTSKDWHDGLRFIQLQLYCEILDEARQGNYRKVQVFLTEEDQKFLKAVCKSSTENSMNRVLSYCTRAMLCSQTGNLEDAVQCVRKALQACDNSTKEERLQSLPRGMSGEQYLDAMKRQCQNSLNGWRNHKTKSFDPGSGQPIEVICHGGEQCDFCFMTFEEGGAMMDCCSLCQLTYYCTKECQKQHWQSHKKSCRKPGEFHVGDVVWPALLGSDKIFPSEGRLRITDKVPSSMLKVETCLVTPCPSKDTSEETGVLVEAKHLRRCRPALWHSYCG